MFFCKISTCFQYVICILLCISLFSLQAQESTSANTAEKKQKIVLGLGVLPSVYSIQSHKGFNHVFRTETGMGGQFSFVYFILPKLAIRSGLGFTQVSYKVDYAFIFTDSLDPMIPRHSDIKLLYADIPAMLMFSQSLTSKWQVNTFAGLTYSRRIHEKDVSYFEDHSIRSLGATKRQLFSLSAGAGLQYMASPSIGLQADLLFRMVVGGFDNFMDRFPKGIHAGLGLVYKL